jgi:hypothetical protein
MALFLPLEKFCEFLGRDWVTLECRIIRTSKMNKGKISEWDLSNMLTQRDMVLVKMFKTAGGIHT